MNILDRFSSHTRDILARAIRLATELKNKEVEPIHLLFCLHATVGSVAGEITSRFKLDAKIFEQLLLSLPNIEDDAAATAQLQATLAPFSAASKTTLEKAIMIAQELSHSYVGSEHILAALIRLKDPMVYEAFKLNKVDLGEFEKQLQTVLNNASQFSGFNDIAEVAERVHEQVAGEGLNDEQLSPQVGTTKKGKSKKDSALDFFGVHLTSEEVQKNVDPVIGRDTEIERLIQILCRRTKNNPILLGDPGVGKTAIIEGLAKKIMEGTVPDILLSKKIYALDLGMLIAGTIYRGEFEARLRQVIDEVTANPDIIIFIDEIHNIVGAGSNQGTMDAANILKPALARGQLHCIGATTPGEFKKHIENDPALERRFQPIYVKEPTPEDTILILKGIKPNYEHFHHIGISDEAVEYAVKLSERYITSKFLPDKAIDLLDETAAAKRLTIKREPWHNKLHRARQKLEKIIIAKEQAAASDKFEEAVKCKDEEEKLRIEIKQIEKEGKSKHIKLLAEITAEDVIRQVAKITGASPAELVRSDDQSLKQLEEKLKERIIGQDQVIRSITQLIRQARLGLSHPGRPLASLLFVGESGVGKTELAKTIAKVLYPGRDALIKLDMSEFNESFGVSKLLGSPAGYIGYKESNNFTDKIKLNPYCVLVFDEIDKAHKDVMKLLLQILEEGEITDSTGRKVSLKHAIIILTTTLGAEDAKKGAIGFGDKHLIPNSEVGVPSLEVERLREFFSPEIMNRIDKICWFNPLNSEQLIKIAELEVKELNQRLTSYHTTLTTEPKLLNWMITQLPKNSGARDVRRLVREQLESLMAEVIMKKNIKEVYTLTMKNNLLKVS
jgi:ATP-dependent Clp protease ATP-binding subunit ClpC